MYIKHKIYNKDVIHSNRFKTNLCKIIKYIPITCHGYAYMSFIKRQHMYSNYDNIIATEFIITFVCQ